VEHYVARVPSLAVAFDFGAQAGGDQLRGGGGPVCGHGVPEDRDEALFAGDAKGRWAACAERWTEVADLRAGDRFELGCGAGELFLDASLAGEGQIGVGPGVIADEVARLVHLADERALGLCVFADHEEGGADVVAGEDFEELGGPAGIGSVVEGERKFVWPWGRNQGAAKELGGGPKGCVGASTVGEAGGGQADAGIDYSGNYFHAAKASCPIIRHAALHSQRGNV